MNEGYDRHTMLGVLGDKPIYIRRLRTKDTITGEIMLFLFFIHDLNNGKIG